MAALSFLDRARTVAPPDYPRWLVPPAALAIHLSIGQAYAFSVFNLPLSRLLGGAQPAPGDWRLSTIGWVFSVAIVFLGASAATFGTWLERVGPRRAMFAAALCFGGGFLVAAAGVATHRFWLLWVMLCVNVTAGIGVLGQASPMIQETFPGAITPGAAAGFVGLLSLANMGERFAWSSVSDVVGRRATYTTFFLLGALLYALVPTAGRARSVAAFVALYVVIMSMYGGGFATIPAYLRDQFGTRQVGAIHGRLLTAWSTAGVLGPALVNYLREYQLARGVPEAGAYTTTMYLMAGLLLVGLACNLLVRRGGEPRPAPSPAAP